MKIMNIDDVEIVMDEVYSESEHGSIIDQNAMLTYAGQTMTVPCCGKGIEQIAYGKYAIILLEKESVNHYAFLTIVGEASYIFDAESCFGSAKSALEAKARFLEQSDLIRKYGFCAIMPLDDYLYDWIKSYMPKKRKRITREQRALVYAKCDGHCAYCGKPITMDEMQVDHVDSHYRHQGEDSVDNYLPSCRDCNGLKSDYLLEEFRNVLIPNCLKRRGCGDTRALRICKAYGIDIRPKKRIVFYFERKEDKDADNQ